MKLNFRIFAAPLIISATLLTGSAYGSEDNQSLGAMVRKARAASAAASAVNAKTSVQANNIRTKYLTKLNVGRSASAPTSLQTSPIAVPGNNTVKKELAFLIPIILKDDSTAFFEVGSPPNDEDVNFLID